MTTMQEMKEKQNRWKGIIKTVSEAKHGISESDLREKNPGPHFAEDISGLAKAGLIVPLGIGDKREFVKPGHYKIKQKHPHREPLKFHRSTP